ncbi:MFS transporter [Actinacidiphila glaucinigra]|uniref:MFS transporter n=1 Tax=Actinacidiphila glaucinigra TaxID=235986 RepID=UPI0035E32BD5
MSSVTKSGYWDLMTHKFLLWAVVSLASKAPVAMAPLALVFLSRESPGGYTLGATLASVYVLGEVVGAPLLGTRLACGRMRGQLSAGLMVGALAFGALPLARSASAPVLTVLAFLAGAAPAACPGGIRSVLTRMVADDMVPRALSAEATLTQIVWAAAPGMVVFLALQVDPGAPLLLGALLAATASLLVFRLPEPQPQDPAERAVAPTARTLLSGWPVYLTSAAAMAMLATAELVLPALLEDRDLSVSWSGPLLAGFALTSAAGAFCYGLRTWPGSVRTQSLVFLAVTATFVSLITLLPGLPGIAVALLLAGVFQSGVMVTRNLSLRERLPESAHAAAYSVMYAVQGLGYSLTASLTAVALDLATPSTAILGGVAITLVITVVSAIAERGTAPRPTAEQRTLADADHGPREGNKR